MVCNFMYKEPLNILHTALIWQWVISIHFQPLKQILVATYLKMIAKWKQLWHIGN